MLIRRNYLILVLIAGGLVGLIGFRIPSALAASDGTAKTLITIESKDAQIPVLQAQDVMLYENRKRVPVTEVTPLAGQPVEVYLAIDEAIGPAFGPFLNDLRSFINSQPATVSIGVAYLREGTANILQKPTADRAAAAKALRLPVANVGVSPFESITDLLKRWPETSARREIVMISPGVEPFGAHEVDNPVVSEAVSAAQRAGVSVFVIYTQMGGHFGHSFWRATWAQAYLSRLADESGGEGYNINSTTIVSLTPFLDDITQRMQRQFLVAFTPQPQAKSDFVPISARTELPHVELVSPDRVWVPANQ